MNRRYTKESYLELAEKIKKAVPDISLTTDIIVGFPGETEEDFQETLDVVRKVRYDSAFTFIYSKRTGTPAAAMEDQIPEEVKQQRLDALMELQQGISLARNELRVGTTCRVLVEGRREGYLVGRSEMEAPETDGQILFTAGEDVRPGSYVDVRITRALEYDLIGERV